MISPASSGLLSDLFSDIPMDTDDNSMSQINDIATILNSISTHSSVEWLRKWASTKSQEISFIMDTLSSGASHDTELDAASLQLLEELFDEPQQPTAAATSSTTDTRDRLLSSAMYTACDPDTDETTRSKATELVGLLQRWKDLTFNYVGKDNKKTGVKVESKYRDFFYHTPRELILWVLNNPAYTPSELYTCITATAYDYDAYGDDQHMYLACSLKKLMDMISMEYRVPLGDMYQKFGRSNFLTCFATTKKGQCSNACYSHVYCTKHKHLVQSPLDAFQKWKAVNSA